MSTPKFQLLVTSNGSYPGGGALNHKGDTLVDALASLQKEVLADIRHAQKRLSEMEILRDLVESQLQALGADEAEEGATDADV